MRVTLVKLTITNKEKICLNIIKEDSQQLLAYESHCEDYDKTENTVKEPSHIRLQNLCSNASVFFGFGKT